MSKSQQSVTSSSIDLPEIRRRIPISQRRRDGFIRFARDIKSQNGEDGIIQKLFEILPQSNSRSHRVCVDIGAWDGEHLSNTYALLVGLPNFNPDNCTGVSKHSEWKGLLVEADKERFQDLLALHSPLGNTCLNLTVSSDPKSANSLVSIFQRHQNVVPDDLDFLSIDVDGSDYWLMHDVLKETQVRPFVICIEANPTMPNDLVYIPPRNDHFRHGASVAALVELADKFGYVLVETTIYNCFFVRKELHFEFLRDIVPDTSIEALHEVTMGTSLYQLYDGTLKLFGTKKLLWHRIGMSEDKIQIIPQSKRNFPFAPSSTFDLSNVVDMSSYCQFDQQVSSKEGLRQACAQELLARLRKDGFALIRGTGLSAPSCVEALSLSRDFLLESEESVRRTCLTKDRARRGYAPIGTENFASLLGNHGPNDLVRKFRIGPFSEEVSSSPLHRPNIWPTEDDWDRANEFRRAVEVFYENVCKTATKIVQAICDGLVDQRPDLSAALDVVMEPENQSHSSILTMLGYRRGARHKKTKKKRNVHPLVASHTDVGIITMLLFEGGENSCARLQRRYNSRQDPELGGNDREEKWVNVFLPETVPKDPIFVINIADCLSELCQKELPSTLHRVIPASGEEERTCLALFMGLDPSAMLTFPDRQVSYEEWRKKRIADAQAVLLSNISNPS